jgi:hypothetical protein
MIEFILTLLMFLGLVIILIIFIIIRIKLDYLRDSLKNALVIMEGEVKIYRKRAAGFSEKLSYQLKSDKDFIIEDWLDDLKAYCEAIGQIKGLNMAIRILKFWLPKNL